MGFHDNNSDMRDKVLLGLMMVSLFMKLAGFALGYPNVTTGRQP